MGIPQYYKWLQTRFEGSFRDGTPKKLKLEVDYVYIDLNCFLHTAARWANQNVDALCRNICRELDNIMNAFERRSLKCVYVAVDGPASRAKVLVQRKRRRAKIGTGSSAGGSSGTPASRVDLSVGLSPGTTVMAQLSDWLAWHCASAARKFGVEIKLNTAAVPGEGEHKIIREMWSQPAGRHCVVGSDSDLFLIVLALELTGEVYCWDGVSKPGSVFQRSVMRNQILTSAMDKNIQPSLKLPCEEAITRDFTLLSLLKGDDYLPAIGGFESCYAIYEKNVKKLCQVKSVAQWAILTCEEVLSATGDVMDSVWLHCFYANTTLADCLSGRKWADNKSSDQFLSFYTSFSHPLHTTHRRRVTVHIAL